jgi:leader peptidase (prepilin peptidase)/N-methyltransferase
MNIFESTMFTFSTYPSVFYGTILILGLLVGSFLNVVIYRLPIMMQREWQSEFINYFAPKELPPPPGGVGLNDEFNLAHPRSACPNCKSLITATENIPIVSYVFKKGRCQHCNHPIPKRYPIVEALTALVSLWCAWHFGPTVQCGIMLIVTWILISAICIDLDHMLLPDQLTLPLLWIGLLSATHSWFVSLEDAVWGAVIGYLILWIIYWAFKLLTGKEGMGYGDFKLLSALGAFVGWQHLLVIILLSSVVAIVFALIAQAIPTNKQKDATVPDGAFPFGPFLGIAGWLTILYGEPIVRWYFVWTGIA